jgi:hypothetical protein
MSPKTVISAVEPVGKVKIVIKYAVKSRRGCV